MQKWQYLRLEWFQSIQYAPFNYSLNEWLKARFPKARVVKNFWGQILWDVSLKDEDKREAIFDVINFLGSHGWEAVRIVGDAEEGGGWFKRPIED